VVAAVAVVIADPTMKRLQTGVMEHVWGKNPRTVPPHLANWFRSENYSNPMDLKKRR